jgi:hypothetical protein
MPNKSKVFFLGTPGGGPGDFWRNGTALEGSQQVLSLESFMLINVPIPAGVNVTFAIMLNIMGATPNNAIPVALKRYAHAAVRDGAGVLTTTGFGSGNSMQQMTAFGGSGGEQPELDTGNCAVNANSIDYAFLNTAAGGASSGAITVHWQVLVSPALPVTPA